MIIGKNHKGTLLTIVDRKTGFVIIENVGSKKADIVARATVNALDPFKEFTHTITNDNGKEFALHEKFAKNFRRMFSLLILIHPGKEALMNIPIN